MMFARDVQRFHAILGLEDVVAVGVEQIMEELHVELIVFHDQDRLGFGVHGCSPAAYRHSQSPKGALAVLSSIRDYLLTLP